MRKKLRKIEEKRRRFTATFERFGRKENWLGYGSDLTIIVVYGGETPLEKNPAIAPSKHR